MPSDDPHRDFPLTCRVCEKPIQPGEEALFVIIVDRTGLHDECDRSLLVGTR